MATRAENIARLRMGAEQGAKANKGTMPLNRGTIIRIRSVDMYGLNGREHHPEQGDIGRIGTIREVQELYDDNGRWFAPLIGGNWEQGLKEYNPETWMALYLVEFRVRGDIELLQLSDYEFDVIASTGIL